HRQCQRQKRGAGEPALSGAARDRGHPANQPPRTAPGKSRHFRLRAFRAGNGGDRAARATRRAHRRLRLFRVTAMGLARSSALARGTGCVAPVAALVFSIALYVLTSSGWAEPANPVRARALSREETALPRPRPEPVPAQGAENGPAVVVHDVKLPENFRELAKRPGEPQIPGLTIIYLHPLGSPGDAVKWQNVIVHETEGQGGSAKSMALAQAKDPAKRGVTVWVETDGTVYWSTAENAIPTHGDGANRNDNKYIDNSKTYRRVIKTNSIGVEF